MPSSFGFVPQEKMGMPHSSHRMLNGVCVICKKEESDRLAMNALCLKGGIRTHSDRPYSDMEPAILTIPVRQELTQPIQIEDAQPERTREDDQPLPVENDFPAIQDLVMIDLEARKAVGIRRYGTLLKPHNGRDMLRDAYEESLDQTNYLRGCLYERDGK